MSHRFHVIKRYPVQLIVSYWCHTSVEISHGREIEISSGAIVFFRFYKASSDNDSDYCARNEISCQLLARNSDIPINWLLRFARGLNDKRLENCCMYAIPGEIGFIWFLRYVRCECNIEESLDHEWRIEYLIRIPFSFAHLRKASERF